MANHGACLDARPFVAATISISELRDDPLLHNELKLMVKGY